MVTPCKSGFALAVPETKTRPEERQALCLTVRVQLLVLRGRRPIHQSFPNNQNVPCFDQHSPQSISTDINGLPTEPLLHEQHAPGLLSATS
jgi:hypothetical protein